jgi:hypothetical protein
VEELSLQERVAFLKGASLLLGDRLRPGQDCICNMLAAVILPVAAYASLLREDVALARKTWKTFAKIPRLCAEKLKIEKEEDDEHLDLRRLTFDQYISELTGDRRGLSESELGRLAAERIEDPSSWSVIAHGTGFKTTIKPRYYDHDSRLRHHHGSS